MVTWQSWWLEFERSRVRYDIEQSGVCKKMSAKRTPKGTEPPRSLRLRHRRKKKLEEGGSERNEEAFAGAGKRAIGILVLFNLKSDFPTTTSRTKRSPSPRESSRGLSTWEIGRPQTSGSHTELLGVGEGTRAATRPCPPSALLGSQQTPPSPAHPRWAADSRGSGGSSTKTLVICLLQTFCSEGDEKPPQI